MFAPIRNAAFLCLLLSSCTTSENDPKPTDPVPYFTIHSGVNLSNMIITNGKGEIVKFRSGGKTEENLSFMDSVTQIENHINLYFVSKGTYEELNLSSYSITAYVGVEPGHHYYAPRPPFGQQGPYQYSLFVNVHNVPPYASIEISSPTAGFSIYGEESSYISEFLIFDEREEFFINLYSDEGPMYAPIEKIPNGLQEISYPKDFLFYDHVLSVPLGDNPWHGRTMGFLDGNATSFLGYNCCGNEESIHLPYLYGFDYYRTEYNLPNQSYLRIGTIPTLEEAIIPQEEISVLNTSINSFEAYVSENISVRASYYEFAKNIDGHTHQYYLTIYSDPNNSDAQLDLDLPLDFIDGFEGVEFHDEHYTGSKFTNTSRAKSFQDWIKWRFHDPQQISVLEEQTYTYDVD